MSWRTRQLKSFLDASLQFWSNSSTFSRAFSASLYRCHLHRHATAVSERRSGGNKMIECCSIFYMQKHIKIKTQLLGIEMYYLLYRTHWPLTPPEHSPYESIPSASREPAGWTFEHHSELRSTAPETSDSTTDFHITWGTRRDTNTQAAGDFTQPKWMWKRLKSELESGFTGQLTCDLWGRRRWLLWTCPPPLCTGLARTS